MEMNEELLFAEEDRKTVEFILHYLPQEVKERITEDEVYYFLDVFAEYCEESGLLDSDNEEAEIDIDEAAAYMVKQAKKDKMGDFSVDDVRWIVDGELEYGEQVHY